MRFDSSLQQNIWLCKDAVKSNTPAIMLNPSTARTLEKKGIATFQDIWNERSQTWGLEPNRWNALSRKEQSLLGQVMQEVHEYWPTTSLVSSEPSLKHWDFKGGIARDSHIQLWNSRLAVSWQREGCFLTAEACRKKLRDTWRATKSGRLNMLLWRVFSRKLPVREKVSKWG